MLANGYEIEAFADLRDANLRDADLLGANLRGAALRDLRGANLEYADLRGADLRGATLVRANIRGADLRGVIGMILLPVQDMRGYSFTHAIETDDGWRIRAGCRDFSIDEALAHWGADDYEDRERGDDYVYAVKWLQRKLEKMEQDK